MNTKFQQTNRVHSRNAFDALGSIFGFISDRIEYQNLKIGALVAHEKNVKLRLFYTSTVLTTNSLVFEKNKMSGWWLHLRYFNSIDLNSQVSNQPLL